SFSWVGPATGRLVFAYRQPVTSFFQVQTFGGVYGLSVIIVLVVVKQPYLSVSLRPMGLACKGPSTWHSFRLLRQCFVAGGRLPELGQHIVLRVSGRMVPSKSNSPRGGVVRRFISGLLTYGSARCPVLV